MRVITEAYLYLDSGRIELIPVSFETMEKIKNKLGDVFGIPRYICLKKDDDGTEKFLVYPSENGIHAIEAAIENIDLDFDLTNNTSNNIIVSDE